MSFWKPFCSICESTGAFLRERSSIIEAERRETTCAGGGWLFPSFDAPSGYLTQHFMATAVLQW